MIQQIKNDLYQLVKRLGYNIVDNSTYIEKFPWLMMRLNSYEKEVMVDCYECRATIIIDIFSTYKGEKEILDIAENITNHIWELKENNDKITYLAQQDLKIIDDNATGPVKKHGVLAYSFLFSSNINEEG